MTQDQEREAFEAAALDAGIDVARYDYAFQNGQIRTGDYVTAETQCAWRFWQARAALAAPTTAQAVPDGWREQFASAVYDDLASADNQDVPLEDYPVRILRVLDSIVGARHPTVIQWRNDAIRNCIAIAYKYCRDPESHRYLKQDLEAMIAAAPTAPAQPWKDHNTKRKDHNAKRKDHAND